MGHTKKIFIKKERERDRVSESESEKERERKREEKIKSVLKEHTGCVTYVD